MTTKQMTQLAFVAERFVDDHRGGVALALLGVSIVLGVVAMWGVRIQDIFAAL